MVPATRPATTQPNHHQLSVSAMVSMAAKSPAGARREYPVAQRPQQLLKVRMLAAAYYEGTQDGGNDPAPANNIGNTDWESVNSLPAAPARATALADNATAEMMGADVGLEQVRTPSLRRRRRCRNVVCNDAGVAGIILGDTGFDLTNQV